MVSMIVGRGSRLRHKMVDEVGRTIPKGTSAAEAAGKIHTDIQKGFIRAEVVAYDDMVAYKGRNGAREAGKVRAEGREYIVKDGDVVLFMHH